MSRQQSRDRSRRKTPDFPIRIERLSHEGRGIAQWGTRTLFVDGALPDELVRVKITSKSSKIAEAVAVEILVASPNRKDPSCPFAFRCGGCALQHMHHHDQMAHKVETFDALMARERVSLEKVERLPTLTGPLQGYRRRARLGVRLVRAKDRVLVGFREKASQFIAEIETCEILDARIGLALPLLAGAIGELSVSDKIPQVEMAAGDDVLALVIRHLAPLSDADRSRLRVLGEETGWHIYLQPKGPDTVHALWPSERPAWPTYRLGEFGLEYRFHVTDFTQINASINRQMVSQAMRLLDFQGTERVLDLFCGLGNFTLAAATRAAEVVGVEVSPTMVTRLTDNALHNGLTNVRGVVCDLTKPLDQQEFAKAQYDTLIVDPPRSGAREVLEALPLSQFDRVLYVSCNPQTLARDSRLILDRGFRMTHAGLMDMFPQTAHVESMALFVKRGRHG